MFHREKFDTATTAAAVDAYHKFCSTRMSDDTHLIAKNTFFCCESTTKLRIEAGPRIDAGPRIQARGLIHLYR